MEESKYHYFYNEKSLKWEFMKINMKKEEDFELAAIEALDSYINSKFPRELRSNYADTIGSIKAGFWAGIKFVKLFYSITRK